MYTDVATIKITVARRNNLSLIIKLLLFELGHQDCCSCSHCL